jgi:hypothetical protein
MSITFSGVIGLSFTGLPVTATQRGKRWVAMKLKGAPGQARTDIKRLSIPLLFPLELPAHAFGERNGFALHRWPSEARTRFFSSSSIDTLHASRISTPSKELLDLRLIRMVHHSKTRSQETEQDIFETIFV